MKYRATIVIEFESTFEFDEVNQGMQACIILEDGRVVVDDSGSNSEFQIADYEQCLVETLD